MVVTTISCDAAILRCSSCQGELATVLAVSDVDCRQCGGTMQFAGRCEKAFSLHKDSILIRCVAENKDGWCCENHGGRDFCPDHGSLATPNRIAMPTPRAVGDR